MTDDELEALCELRDQLFASPATESVPGEGSNPSVLRSDNAARFAAYLLGDDDTIDGYEAEPPARGPRASSTRTRAGEEP